MNHLLSALVNIGSGAARSTLATASLTVATFVVSTLFVATPAQGQDGFIRARINRTSPTSFHVQAGREQGLDEHAIVDAFSDTAYVGSLKIVDVSEGAAELAFLRDDLIGQQQRRPTLTAGDYLYLRFAVGDAGLDRTRGRVRTPGFLDVDLQFASAYDSNIDHNDEPVE
ncbi:MAG: hypothetical protein HKN37_06340, partial [Rhodothermales bacterium]|nr:hypothetical protein [Rhodothermales bacterium]